MKHFELVIFNVLYHYNRNYFIIIIITLVLFLFRELKIKIIMNIISVLNLFMLINF